MLKGLCPHKDQTILWLGRRTHHINTRKNHNAPETEILRAMHR